jgi:hypothetical protein
MRALAVFTSSVAPASPAGAVWCAVLPIFTVFRHILQLFPLETISEIIGHSMKIKKVNIKIGFVKQRIANRLFIEPLNVD